MTQKEMNAEIKRLFEKLDGINGMFEFYKEHADETFPILWKHKNETLKRIEKLQKRRDFVKYKLNGTR